MKSLKLFGRKFNFTGLCFALLVIFIASNGFAQEVPDSFRIFSVEKADGTKDVQLLEDNASVTTFAVNDGQISDLVSITPRESQKLIVKFKEAPLIKYKGKPKTLRDKARSKIDLEHNNFEKDVLALENSSRNAKGKPSVDIKKILKKKYKHVFNGAAVELSSETLTAIKQLSYVEDVYPDVEVKVDLNESVPLIRADQVWNELGITGKGVVVSIVDTGVDYTHPDLGGSAIFPSAKVIGGYDCYNNDNDPMDDHYHGTHVAGIVAANGQLRGVAYEASLMAYKVLSAYGSGYSSTIIQGIELSTDPDGDPATDDGADVINISLGGSGNPDDPMSQAVDNAVDSGVVVAVAAGNSYNYWRLLSPGVARKALTVGASDKTNQLASFSSKGPVVGTYSIKPDVTAPGVNILASQLGGGNRSLSGTSMATPHVAGTAALLLQSNPSLTPAQVKNILMGTAVDIGYDVFSQGSGLVDIHKAVTSKTIVSPASISLGLDDSAQSVWTKAQTVEIKNISGNSTFNTYTVSLASALPAGINVSIPATITLDALTGTGNFDFNISVDNTVLPYPSVDPYSYEGVLLVSNGTDTHRIPFAFIKTPVLTLNFDKSPWFVYIIDRISKYWLRYPAGTSTSITLPQGNYDVTTHFLSYSGVLTDEVVFRENIDVINSTTLNISSTEAVHNLDFTNIVDHAGNPLSISTDGFFHFSHNSGFGIGIMGTVIKFKFSDMSEKYTFDWSVSDLFWNLDVTHELGGRITGGIFSDHDFTNTPDEYRAIEYTYDVDPAVDDIFIMHILWHAFPGGMMGSSSYNIYNPPLTRDANGEFKRMFYIKPFESTDGTTRNYSNQWVYDYTGNGVFESYKEKILCETPLLSKVVDKPFKGYLFPEMPVVIDNVDNPVFSTTDIRNMTVGMGPHYWSGKILANSSSIRVYPTIGQSRRFYISQWGDFAPQAESYWELFDKNGQYVQGGDSTGTNGTALYKTIYLPYAGIYKLVVPYDGYYRINSQPGNITTTLNFDTTKADSSPPYMQHFRVLSGTQVSNSLLGGEVNEIEFDLLDDDTAIENASLFVKPYSSASDWQQIPLNVVETNIIPIWRPTIDVTATKYRANVPNFTENDFISMKLVATDTAGNSLTTEWSPAFYYQTNPGTPVANAGEDQQISVAYGDESAAVTLDGSASYDPDGYIASYLWKEGEVILGNSVVVNTTMNIGTHNISLTVTDNDGFSSTDTMQVIVTQEAPPNVDSAIYVQDIKMTAVKRGKKWNVTAEVTIFDDSNNLVGAADVSGSWSGSINQTVSTVTFAKGKKRIGKAKFTLSRISEGGTFTFAVTDVNKSGMIYYDTLNVETSDTIVIP